MKHNSIHPDLPLEGKVRFTTVKRVAGTDSRSTLWRWERDGKFPKSIRITPRLTVWDAAEVRAWLADPIGWAANNASTPKEA